MPAGKPDTPTCEQFGFDAAWCQAQLALIGLEGVSEDHVRLLHDKVLTHDSVVRIVDRFYEQLLRNRQAAELLSSFDTDRLKKSQIQHFREFGVRCGRLPYCESRARVGVAHARVGVPLSLYLISFGVIQTLILECVLNQVDNSEEREVLTALVLKLITFDIAIATEVYHRSRVQDMDRSLKHMEAQQRTLREQLEQDALTGVSSRTSLLRTLRSAISHASKTGQPLVLIMADLDHFKSINDGYGHLVGDKVLREVAGRIRAALREFDTVGRYGGEEFVILLEDTSPHTAHQIAERVRVRIEAEPIRGAGHSLQITLSQGLAQYASGDTRDSLLKKADGAMYRAKDAGRNCIVEA
jgi:diguanylate cyclase (GGDEF)-like protein